MYTCFLRQLFTFVILFPLNGTKVYKNCDLSLCLYPTASVDLLKMVPIEIFLNFGNYFRTLQLGFGKFLSGIVFLHHYVRTIELFFSQAHSI